MTSRRPLPPADAARRILDAKDERRAVAVVLGLGSEEGGGAPHPATGRRLLVGEGWTEGSLGDGGLDNAARRLALAALAGAAAAASGSGGAGAAAREAPAAPGEGVHTLAGEGGGSVRVYLELHLPQPQLVIVGAGHIARPLCTLGALLDFRVLVLDDRPAFATTERFPEAERVERVDFSEPFVSVHIGAWTHVILVTRGHRYDYECLRRLLRLEPGPGYIGMIGSRRRVRATYVQLREEGIPLERIAGIHAPVGLDLGAETPEEIAVSVAAELTLLRRGGTGRPLREVERIVERFLQD